VLRATGPDFGYLCVEFPQSFYVLRSKWLTDSSGSRRTQDDEKINNTGNVQHRLLAVSLKSGNIRRGT